MSTAPLNRDVQIGLMSTARERRREDFARWKRSAAVIRVLRADDQADEDFARHDDKMSACG